MFSDRLMRAFFGADWKTIRRGVTVTDALKEEDLADQRWMREEWHRAFAGKSGVGVGAALTHAMSLDCSPALASAIVAACRETVA